MSHPQTVQNLFAGQPNRKLFGALEKAQARLEADPSDQSARQTRGWLITELETRLPKAHAHIGRLFFEAEQQLIATGEVTEIDYIAELGKFV